MFNVCSSWASRTGSSCPACSDDGLSVELLGGASVLSNSSWLDVFHGSVNDGKEVACDCAMINGEMAGSSASDDVPVVSTVRVDSLGSLWYHSSAVLFKVL